MYKGYGFLRKPHRLFQQKYFSHLFLIIGGGDLTGKSQLFITTFKQNLHKSVVDLRGNFSV